MIEVTIQYGCNATNLFLPCKDSVIQVAVEALQPPDTNDRNLMVTDIRGIDSLGVLKDRFVDLDKLNYLAKRLDSFDATEMRQFTQAMKYEKFVELRDLINLTFNVQRYPLITDLSDVTEVGREFRFRTQGCISEEEAADPEYAALGKELLSSGKGIITEDGILFVDTSRPFEEVYNGKTFPLYLYEPCFMVASISHQGNTEYLSLPEESTAIERALLRIGAPSADACHIELEDVAGFGEEYLQLCDRILQAEGLEELNSMVTRITQTVLPEEVPCFVAAVTATGVTDSDGVCRIAKYIDSFYIAENVRTIANLGKWWLKNYASESVSPSLEPFFDYKAYGEYLTEHWDVFFLENGNCVFLDDITSIEAVLGKQEAGAIQMGGMA